MTGKPHPARPRAPTPPDASPDGVAPELLDYLFDAPEEPHPTPARALGAVLAQSRLSGWGDEAVRAALARQLCRLLPDLPPDGHDAVTTVALRALEQLTRDHVTFVRAALATAIKDIACAPPPVVQRLARDVERSVAEPILHCCATLTDTDLLAVIASQPTTWALSAIARRRTVSAPVSSAIVEAGDAEATGVLLDNTGAIIPEPALERAVDDSARHRALQAKLAQRPALPPRLALRLAEFVDRSVVAVLRSRPDFDDGTIAEIAATVRRRVEWIERRASDETPERRAVRLHRIGALDETAIGDALSWNEVAFVRAALALRAGAPGPATDLILRSGNPRAVTALVWRAGFSMRCAMQVQARAAGIPPHAMLNARQGMDFPLPPAEMARQLELYGV
ncbi:MAG TPA: DUF2336 domain-containing protein [Azospirillum sp.]|nr:DUF2336 domain-containing protein [Azospirillum sp.]